MGHPAGDSGSSSRRGTRLPSGDDFRTSSPDLLRHQLCDSVFRAIDGFPAGSDEDILLLSDPPWYTACPNPSICDFVKARGNPFEPGCYSVTPFTGKMKAGPRHPVYGFHPYHTKVPPDILKQLIEHYTRPGDLVFDGFCGSGMTGVAARECGRNAILNDLCPIATFISAVNNSSNDVREAESEMERVISESRERWGYLYETLEGREKVPVNYFVWSDVFSCPGCATVFPFFPHGTIHHGNKVETRGKFPCPSCGVELNVRGVARVRARQGKMKELVWVNAGSGKGRLRRGPFDYDLKLARDIEALPPPAWYPVDPVNPDGYSASLAQLGDKLITDVSRFLSRRNLIIFSDLWARVDLIADTRTRNLCRATLTSVFTAISERQGYFGGGGGMSGNLYMPIVRMEKNVYQCLGRKIKKMKAAEARKYDLKCDTVITTQSLTSRFGIPDDSIDYIYTDPPFGGNIMYSEMNLILEAWLRVRACADAEVVIDPTRGKSPDQYASMMKKCFTECFRMLKPGRFMSVEFHNTKSNTWNLLHAAIRGSGFVIARVDVLDKGSTTILGDIRPCSAKRDLVITARKPHSAMAEECQLMTGTKETAWRFMSEHLAGLPLPEDRTADIPERRKFLLFDRMVAFHILGGLTVPLSASEFYSGLVRRYPCRNGMYFLPGQLGEAE